MGVRPLEAEAACAKPAANEGARNEGDKLRSNATPGGSVALPTADPADVDVYALGLSGRRSRSRPAGGTATTSRFSGVDAPDGIEAPE